MYCYLWAGPASTDSAILRRHVATEQWNTTNEVKEVKKKQKKEFLGAEFVSNLLYVCPKIVYRRHSERRVTVVLLTTSPLGVTKVPTLDF